MQLPSRLGYLLQGRVLVLGMTAWFAYNMIASGAREAQERAEESYAAARGRQMRVTPLEPTQAPTGGSGYDWSEEPEPFHSHTMEIETMRANERMGAALAFIYSKHPELKAEVRDFLDDYPFTF